METCVIGGNILRTIMSSQSRAFCTLCRVPVCRSVHSEVCLEACHVGHGVGPLRDPSRECITGHTLQEARNWRWARSRLLLCLLCTMENMVLPYNTLIKHFAPQMNELLKSMIQRLFRDSFVSSGMFFFFPSTLAKFKIQSSISSSNN